MNTLSYYVTKRLIVGSKDSSGTIIDRALAYRCGGWEAFIVIITVNTA